MIHIAQAIIVEGKYDKIKLSSILDAVILVTNGFHIFHDAEKMSLIRYYAKTTGVIILTDSDTAGFKIRHYLKGAVHEGKLYHVYIPDIYGKERRKDNPSAEGKLGVEGIDKKRLLEAFGKAGILAEEAPEKTDPITKLDLYELGLMPKPMKHPLAFNLSGEARQNRVFTHFTAGDMKLNRSARAGGYPLIRQSTHFVDGGR